VHSRSSRILLRNTTMVIILEGCDKTGKSTLAQYIVEKYGFKLIKCSQPKKGEAYNEYTGIIEKISKGKENYVIDRMHLGEEVYGPIYRGRSELTQEQFQDIEKRLNDLNTVLIYCYDREENIARRFIDDGETFTKTENIQDILDKYLVVVKKSALPKYRHKMKGQMDLIKNGEINKIIKKWLFIGK